MARGRAPTTAAELREHVSLQLIGMGHSGEVPPLIRGILVIVAELEHQGMEPGAYTVSMEQYIEVVNDLVLCLTNWIVADNAEGATAISASEWGAAEATASGDYTDAELIWRDEVVAEYTRLVAARRDEAVIDTLNEAIRDSIDIRLMIQNYEHDLGIPFDPKS